MFIICSYYLNTGKGNTSDPRGLIDVIEAGAAGLKLHEDWGTVRAFIIITTIA